MKSLLMGLFLGLLVTGCGKHSEDKSQGSPEGPVISLQAKSGVFTGTADFGVFTHNSSNIKLVTFNLKNDGTEPLSGVASIDNLSANYSISYSNCPAILAVKKTCTIKVAFDSRTATAGTHTANLNFDSVFVAMTAVKESPPVVVENLVSFIVSSLVTTSVDFGIISEKQSVIKTITVKNTGLISLNSTVTAPVGYVLSYDTCSGKTIAKNSSCQVKVSLSGAGKSGIVSGNLSYAGKNLALSGEVVAASSGGNTSLYPSVGFLDGTTPIIEPASYDFGIFSGAENKQLVLNIKNSGTLATATSTAVLNNSNFTIVYNQCLNKSLAVNSSCQVRVLFSATGKSVNEYTANLSFAGKSIALTAEVEPLIVGGAQKTTYTPNSSSIESFETIMESQFSSGDFSMNTGDVVVFRINFNQETTFDAIRLKESYIEVSVTKSDNSVIFSQSSPLVNNTASFPLQTISAGDYITVSLRQSLTSSGSEFNISQFKNGKGSISNVTKNGIPQAYGPYVLVRRIINVAYFSLNSCDGSFEGFKIRPDLITASDIETTGFANNQNVNGYTSSIVFNSMSAYKDIPFGIPPMEEQALRDQYPDLEFIPSGLKLNEISSYSAVTVPQGYDCFNFGFSLKQIEPFTLNKYSLWVEPPVAPPATPLSFSPTLISPSLVLSNSNKTISAAGAPVISWGYLNKHIDTTVNGKYYIELKFTTPYYSYIGGNFLNADPSIFFNGGWPFGLTAGYTGFYAHQAEGLLYQNSGASAITNLNWTDQSVVMLALDLQNNKVWEGVNGVWSGGDPSTNIGGLNISTARGSFSRFYFAVALSSGSVEILNTNQYTPPAGFISP